MFMKSFKLYRHVASVVAFSLGGFLTALAFSQSAYATDGISCTGSITTVGVHGTNRVMLQLSGMNAIVQICDLGQTVGTTFPNTADECKADYSTLLTAYALGKTVNVFFDNVQTGTNCTNFATWELAVARWVHLDG
jgi:hypothetical protein